MEIRIRSLVLLLKFTANSQILNFLQITSILSAESLHFKYLIVCHRLKRLAQINPFNLFNLWLEFLEAKAKCTKAPSFNYYLE